MRSVRISVAVLLVLSLLCVSPALAAEPEFLPAVRTFADNVLRYGRDTYGPKHTALLADGVNIDTHEPATWLTPEEQATNWNMPRRWVLSNLASQQILFRVLASVSQLTGDAKYKQAAVDATRYAFEHLRHDNGLLYWGGHAAWDLASDQPVGEGRTQGVAGKHELKCNYPWYELMWEIDPDATRRFIRSFWANHILRWDILDMNRHGTFKSGPDKVWDHEYVGGPLPFAGKGLTFSNTGSDLYYSAALLYQFDGDKDALTWSKRLAQRYVDVRNPQTGLGADNYSIIEPDRMTKQFGAEFGNRFTEASVTSLYNSRYSRVAVCQLKLGERLGDAGKEFIRWGLEDLTSFAKHAYDRSDNSFFATLIDGTQLSPADLKRPGYVEARWLDKRPAVGIHLWAYALAYRLTGDAFMWQMVRDIAKGNGLGDPGENPKGRPALDLQTKNADVDAVFALLELRTATGKAEYLELARRIGRNLLAREFHKGFFVSSPEHVMCKFDTVTPLALLYIDAASREPAVRLPDYNAGKSFFHCYSEIKGRTYDHRVIYTQLRDGTLAE